MPLETSARPPPSTVQAAGPHAWLTKTMDGKKAKLCSRTPSTTSSSLPRRAGPAADEYLTLYLTGPWRRRRRAVAGNAARRMGGSLGPLQPGYGRGFSHHRGVKQAA